MSSQFTKFDFGNIVFRETNRLSGVPKAFNLFDFHPHRFFTPMVSLGTSHSVGMATHIHSPHLALTCCLVLQVNVSGSVRKMAPGVVLLGWVGYTLVDSYMNSTFINFDSILLVAVSLVSLF